MALVYPFLSKEVLDGFKYKYKYSSKDTSPFSCYIMHPFWDKLVLLFPKWVAPNVLTFLGFLSLAVQIGTITFYDPHFTGIDTDTIPNWVWLASAIAVFAAHQLDGIDGKQARRTGSSGPLGELFDHGVDSLSTFFLPLGLFSLFGHGTFGQPPLIFLIGLYTIELPFVFAQWEKYLTGILYLPWAYDIGMAAVTVTYFVAWFNGGGKCFQHYILGGYTMSTLLVTACVFSVILSAIVSIYNVVDSYAKKTGRMISSPYEALLPLFSPTVLFSVVTAWAIYSPGGILESHERWLVTLHGFIFSSIATRIIVSHMSQTRNQPVNAFVAILVVGLALLTGGVYFLGRENELVLAYECYFLKSITIFVVADHIYYAYCVVNQMADHLDIPVFRIKPKPLPKTN